MLLRDLNGEDHFVYSKANFREDGSGEIAIEVGINKLAKIYTDKKEAIQESARIIKAMCEPVKLYSVKECVKFMIGKNLLKF